MQRAIEKNISKKENQKKKTTKGAEDRNVLSTQKLVFLVVDQLLYSSILISLADAFWFGIKTEYIDL